MKQCQDHQVGIGEAPLSGLRSSGLCSVRGPNQKTEVAKAGQIPKVLEADSRETGDFFLGENFLARADGDGVHGHSTNRHIPQYGEF